MAGSSVRVLNDRVAVSMGNAAVHCSFTYLLPKRDARVRKCPRLSLRVLDEVEFPFSFDFESLESLLTLRWRT